MFGWSWKKIAIAAAGALTFAAGFVFPVAAPILSPLGAGIVGLAVRTPGDVSTATLEAHGRAVVSVVVPAVVQAVVANRGQSVGAIAAAAEDAAAAVLARQSSGS